MANKPLVFSEDGMMKSGTLIRHLVLPQNVEDSKNVLLAFSESGLKDRAYINVMSQYTPFGNTEGFPELGRKITKREYATVIDYAISLGIEKCFIKIFFRKRRIYPAMGFLNRKLSAYKKRGSARNLAEPRYFICFRIY